MAFSTPPPEVKSVSIMGGTLYAKKEGEQVYRDCGVVASATLTIASEKIELYNSKCAIKELVDSQIVKVTYTLPLVFNSITNENLQWFFAGNLNTVTDTVGTGVEEDIALIKGKYAFIGDTLNKPTGDRNITINSVTHKAGGTASARANTTAYTLNTVIVPAVANNHAYICTVAGTSGAAPPTYPTNGTTVTDGTVTWKDLGLIIIANTDYLVDSKNGMLYLKDTCNMIDGQVYTIDYDRAASTRTQISSGGSAVKVSFKIVGCSSPAETTKTFEFKECTIEPNGEIPILSSEAAYAQLAITATGTKSALGYEIVYVDGVAV